MHLSIAYSILLSQIKTSKCSQRNYECVTKNAYLTRSIGFVLFVDRGEVLNSSGKCFAVGTHTHTQTDLSDRGEVSLLG